MKNLVLKVCAVSAFALSAAFVGGAAAQVTVNPDALGGQPDNPPPVTPKPVPPKPAASKPTPPAPAKPPAVKPTADKAAPPKATLPKATVNPAPKKPVAAKPPAAKPPAAVAAPVIVPPAAAPPLTATSSADRDRLDLQRVSAYLNSIRTLQGQFVQVGPNGEMDQGLIYVSKPGRMRFEYAKPSPYLIVADGVSVAVGNSQVKTVDRYPLIDNPLSLILDDKIDLGKTAAISRIERKPGQIVITAKREEGGLKGQVTLIFAEPSLELRQWVVTDAQGMQTMITLQNVQTGVTLNPELFILRDVNKFADPRE